MNKHHIPTIKIKIGFVLLLLLCISVCFSYGETAASGGSWIGTSAATFSSGTSHSYDPNSSSCGNGNWRWMVDCSGVSWAFYKATSITNHSTPLPYHVIQGGGSVSGSVPAECSKHMGNNGGFWHLGINARGATWIGDTIYAGDGYEWGHWVTLNMAYVNRFGLYSIHWFDPKNQNIGVYRLEKYGEISDVLEQYNKALVAAGKQEVKSLPDELYSFCYWDGMDVNEVTLTAYAVTENGTELYGGQSIGSEKVNSGTSASVSWRNISGFQFLGWRDDKWRGDVSNTDKYTVSRLNNNKTIYAVYRAQSKVSTVELKVKNNSVSAYDNCADEVYAKPGDEVQFCAIYQPVVQQWYSSLTPEKYRINNGTITDNTKGRTIGGLVTGWSNKIALDNNLSVGVDSLIRELTYTNGDSAKKEIYPKWTVAMNSVGNVLTESLSTVTKSGNKTPTSITMSVNVDDKLTLASVSTQSISDTAAVRIPYNFENDVDFATNIEEELELTAGTERTISFNIVTKKRQNDTTGGNYVTKVDGAKYRVYSPDFGANLIGGTGNEGTTAALNITNSSIDATTSISNSSTKIRVPDVPAGTTFDVCVGVWPRDSGAETNTSIDGYTNEWVDKCKTFTVAKKPTLQVWGGNVYSAGKINTSVFTKNIEGGSRTFGSWGELGVIVGSVPSGFGSGASMGYGGMNNGGAQQYAGSGSSSDKLNDHSLLTIPNQFIISAGSIPLTVKNNVKNLTVGNKNSIAAKFGLEGRSTSQSNVLNNGTFGGETEKYQTYYYKGDNGNITGNTTLSEGSTYIIHSTNNINISGNIQYLDTKYQSFAKMPKVIIYSDQNINIACNVNRIDALIVANGTVDTCSNADMSNNNGSERSNQLTVNGAIIANELNAKRTYGAATSWNSIIPAEIINFDPSLYLFAGERSSSGGTNATLRLESIKERAPRL